MSELLPLIAFDFDGVICNSLHDSIMTAVNAYIQFEPNHTFPVSEPLIGRAVYEFETANPEFYQQFVALMPLGNFAKDYYVFLKLLEEGNSLTIHSQDAFDQFRESLNPQKLDAYSYHFYAYRSHLQQSDPETWIELLPVFESIPETIQSLSKECTLAIATSKDIQSVTMLLTHYGLTGYFHPDNILDKDFAPTKRDHLIKFHEIHGTPYDAMHFIDDKVSHLIDVVDLGVHCYLATWGFNAEREYQVAESHGCRLLSLHDIINILS